MEILHGVSLKIPDKGIVGIIGPNGCGKSTLLKTIVGQLRASRGKVTLNSEDITNIRPHLLLRKGLSMAPQGHRVVRPMSVKENLILGAFICKDREEKERRLEEVYSLFPVLNEKQNHRAGTLSGGEQAMTNIARALMSNPSTLMLDEPSLGLAPKVVHSVYEKVSEIANKGVSMLIVEQNVRKLLDVATYIYALEQGTNQFEGTSDQIKKDEKLVALYLGLGRLEAGLG